MQPLTRDRLTIVLMGLCFSYCLTFYSVISFDDLCGQYSFEEASRGVHNHTCRVLSQTAYNVTFYVKTGSCGAEQHWTQDSRGHFDVSVDHPCWSTTEQFTCGIGEYASLYHDLPESACGKYLTNIIAWGALTGLMLCIGSCVTLVWAIRVSMRPRRVPMEDEHELV